MDSNQTGFIWDLLLWNLFDGMMSDGMILSAAEGIFPERKDNVLNSDNCGRILQFDRDVRHEDALLRLTKKADYGLLAVKYLAEHPESASQSAKDISEAYHIPLQLLAKILQRLTKVGLLRSQAGMNGGYALSKSPTDITAFEVIHAIDGPLFITSCITISGSCDLNEICTIKEPLRRVNDSISDLLKSIRISDLVEADPASRQHPLENQLVTIH